MFGRERMLMLRGEKWLKPDMGVYYLPTSRRKRREAVEGKVDAVSGVKGSITAMIDGLKRLGEVQPTYFGPGGVNALVSKLAVFEQGGDKKLGLSSSIQIEKMDWSGQANNSSTVARKVGKAWKAVFAYQEDERGRMTKVVKDMVEFKLGDRHGVMAVERLSPNGDFAYPDRTRVVVRVLDTQQWGAYLEDPRVLDSVRGYGIDSDGFSFHEFWPQTEMVHVLIVDARLG